jgi:hypothetical protein
MVTGKSGARANPRWHPAKVSGVATARQLSAKRWIARVI